MPKAIKPHALSTPASPSTGKRLALIVHTAYQYNTVSSDSLCRYPVAWVCHGQMSGPTPTEDSRYNHISLPIHTSSLHNSSMSLLVGGQAFSI